MKKLLSVLLCGLLVFGLTVPSLAATADDAGKVDVSRPEKAHLAFNEDGKFTILQIADIQDDAVLPLMCKELLKAAIEETQPDLIVLTGDNIGGYSCGTKTLAKSAIRQYMDIFERYGIPVAAVFGNHDDEGTPLTKEMQFDVYESYKCFVGCKGVIAEKTVGENTMKNVGTYNVPIFSSADSDDVAYNIWCFDSGNYNPDDAYGGYGYVLQEQLDWYVERSNELKEANGGELVPSIAFQHIVPPQIKDALKEVDEGTEGAVGFAGSWYTLPDDVDPETNWLTEAPCPPNLSFADGYKQVDTMLEQGDVKAIFFGHDHINSYIVNYEGIDLVSSPGCTYASYNDDHRGFRVITLDKNEPDTYETVTYTAEELLAGSTGLRSFLYKLSVLWDKIVAMFDRLKAMFN